MTCEFAPVSTSIHTGSPETAPWRSGNGNARPFRSKRSSTERRSGRGAAADLGARSGIEAARVAPDAVREGGASPVAPPHEASGARRRHEIRLAARTSRLAEDLHDVGEEFHGLGARTLEGVAPHDAAEGAARGHAAHVLEESVCPLGLAAREDDDALAVERALDDVPDAIGHGLGGNPVLLEDLLRFRLLDEIRRRL